jgi:tetratricopeptide (TPR) repeat protein
LDYLTEAIEKYKNHEYSKEILRALGRMLAEILPEDATREIDQEMKNLQQFRDNILLEVKIKIQERKIEEAHRLIQKIVPDEVSFTDDRVSQYFTFNNPLEQSYYQEKFHPEKNIRIIPYNYNDIFNTYAWILVELGDYENAIRIIDRGLKYNPLNVDLLFEKGEIFKRDKNLKGLKEITSACHEYAYRPRDLARVFRNYGYIFVEEQNYDAAISSLMLSGMFEKNNWIDAELFYISQRTKQIIDLSKYDVSTCIKILKNYGLPWGANPKMLELAYKIRNLSFQNEDYSACELFGTIVFNLTKRDEDFEFFQKIKQLKGQKENG